MSLTKTLFASAALCALCTAPALARGLAPSIHVAGIESASSMKVGAAAHSKTNAANPDRPSFTETITFTGTLSTASAHKVPILLWAETWYSSASCTQPTNEKLITPKTTAVARIHHGTSTGNISGCGSTIFTFYGPIYTLEKKHATSDSFQSLVTAHNFVGYNLKLVANTDLTITK
jgi:hypothetical protein